jgi:hypothetical protein
MTSPRKRRDRTIRLLEVGDRLGHRIGVLLSEFRWSAGVSTRVFGKEQDGRDAHCSIEDCASGRVKNVHA